MEVAEPPQRGIEGRHAPLHHVAVEHDRGVRPALVGRHPLHDRLAADLLLGVEGEAHVDRELARSSELARRLDEHEELRLVVRDPARVEPAVALDELERRRVPELERVRRLDVEVRVAEDGRRRVCVARCAHLADDERASAVPRHDVGLASGGPDELGDPLRRGDDVAGVQPHPR